MSVRVRGTLIIDRKHGKRGDFNVGELSSDIGEFEIKDSLIEEFEPGRYTGEFIIKWIEPDPFMWRGRVFVKNRATLDEILIDDVDETADATPALPPEPDPIEAPAPQRADPPAPAAPASAPTAHRKTLPEPASHPAGPRGEEDLRLFGDEIHAAIQGGEVVHLDPTVDRETFRRQRDRLKALGFRFDAMAQTWSKAAPVPA